MSQADGSVIIDTELDTTGIKKGTEEIKDELGEVGKNSDNAGDKIGGSLASGFKKLGKVIAAAGIVDMLVDFGKEAIELGSDLEEVQNVVDVTFETMSDSVNQFAKDAKKSAGLSEKMAKQYVGTFGAMADSFGFTEQEAYAMSTALTQLTGDVASFYNLSQDEAATKLNGVFTGETEALKELGVVMTQAALDNYALANGFSKTTSEMTEQEKVALRYQFVMDQLSAASGDFVRTQDSWANQSKILSLQWESLMATLGTGLIEMLTPSVKFLNNDILPALQDATEWVADLMNPPPSKKLKKSLESVASSMEVLEEGYRDTAEEIDNNVVKAEIYRQMLLDLEASGLDTAEAQAKYSSVVEQLNTLYPDLNLQVDEHTGLIDDDSRAMLQNLNIMKERALMAAVESKYSEMLTAQATATMAVTDAQSDLAVVEAERAFIEHQLTEATGLSIAQLYEQDVAQRTCQESTRKLTAEQQTLLLNLTLLKGEETSLNKTIAEGEATISGYDDKLNELRKTYGLTEDSAEGLAGGQENVAESAEAATQKVEELQQSYLDAKESARASIDAQVGLFDELKAESELTTDDIVANWKSQQAGFDQYKQDLQKAVELKLDETIVKQLSDGSEESMAILHTLVNDTELNVEDFNEQFKATEEARETVSEMMAGIQTDLSKKFSQMYSSVSGAWGDMDDATRDAINSMMKSINSLKGKTIYITTKYQTSGSPSGSSSSGYSSRISQPTNYTADVPYLASGAVIPPNAPFMAVLGDQRHGKNIEAPLSTIQEAVAIVMEDMVQSNIAGHEATVSVLQAILEAVNAIDTSDERYANAVDAYRRKVSVARGV